MSKKKLTTRRGFTLVELTIATTLAIIVMFAMGIVIADCTRGWHVTYNRIYSDVVTNSYVARRAFDTVIRKASRQMFLLGDTGNWLEVYYYADPNSTAVDRYARFYLSGNELKIEYGSLDPRTALSTWTICSDVSSCVFKGDGRSVQMILTLDNGSQTATVVSSAVMHNRGYQIPDGG